MAEPVARTRQRRTITAAGAALALAGAVVVLWLPRATTLVGLVLLTLTCHGPLSPFLPATFEPILLLYGRLYPPLLVAALAAVASAPAEYLNYHLYRTLLRCEPAARVMRGSGARAVGRLFARRPFLAIWVCAWSPLPDWAARILAAHARYSVPRYLVAFIAGRLPKFWLLASVGLYWAPSGAVLWTVAGVSVAVTVGSSMWRSARTPRGQQQPQPDPHVRPWWRRGASLPGLPVGVIAPPRLPPLLVLSLSPGSLDRSLSRDHLLGVVASLPHRVLRVVRHRVLGEGVRLAKR